MDVMALGKLAQRFAIDNSPQILTVVGVAGTVSTAVLTGKAAYKAALLIQDAEKTAWEGYDHVGPRERVQLTWQLFIPAAGTGLLTVSAIIAGSHISASRAAGLAAAYTISEQAFGEYRDKVIEKMGEKKEQIVRDELAQEKVHRTDGDAMIVVSGTDVLCFDMFSGRYFTGSMEGLKQAQNSLNHQMLSDGYASVSDFYDRIGLAPTEFSDQVGWISEELMELTFSTVISEDQRPCLAVSFQVKPNRRFDRFL